MFVFSHSLFPEFAASIWFANRSCSSTQPSFLHHFIMLCYLLCPGFMLCVSSFILFICTSSWNATRGWCPREFANRNSCCPLRPSLLSAPPGKPLWFSLTFSEDRSPGGEKGGADLASQYPAVFLITSPSDWERVGLICLRPLSQHSKSKSTEQEAEAVKEVRGRTWLKHSRLTILVTNQHRTHSLFCCSLPSEHRRKAHKTRLVTLWSAVTHCPAPRRPQLCYGQGKVCALESTRECLLVGLAGGVPEWWD